MHIVRLSKLLRSELKEKHDQIAGQVELMSLQKTSSAGLTT